MGDNGFDQDFSHTEDILGSLPMLKRYVVLCLFFHLANEPGNDDSNLGTTDDAAISKVRTALTDALERLGRAFPYLTGQVVYKGRDESIGHTGHAKIVPLPREGGSRIELITNDLRESFPSMNEIQKTRYPFSVLDPHLLMPPISTSWVLAPFDRIAPVLVMQANFIHGGMILGIAGNHATMDMTGMGGVISLFAKACRNELFSQRDLETGNQNRINAIPLLGNDYHPGPELDDSIVKPPPIQSKDNKALESPQIPARWAYFNFSAANLLRLKKDASNQSLVPYISTDDAIAALCWQRVSQVRKARLLSDGIDKTQFCRLVSVRKFLNLENYLGHMCDCVYEHDRVSSLPNQQLGDITGRLRRIVLNGEGITHHIRAFATYLSQVDDKSKLINGALLDPNTDVIMSSYANIKCCELSFGDVLGMPDAARRPRMTPWPALLYLMPKSRDDDIAVAFCLREDDLEKLRNDESFNSYAQHIG